MKRLAPVLILFLLITSCSNSHSKETIPEITWDIREDVNNLLPEGLFIVDILGDLKQNRRQEELNLKFKQGVRENQDWFIEYMKTVPQGESLPYHINLGLTEQEYEEWHGFMEDIEFVSIGQENVEIIQKGAIISFKSKEKLKALELLEINMESNTVRVGEYNLWFDDTSNIANDKNALRSKWKGYTWRYEYPKEMDLDGLNDLGNLTAIQYKVTIGQLDKTGRTYISIKGREIINGEKEIDFYLPLVFGEK